MTIRSLILSTILLAVATHPLCASQKIQGSPADATPEDSSPVGDGQRLNVRDLSKDALRTGTFETNNPTRRAAVVVFPLPNTPLPSSLERAEFSIRLFAKRAEPSYDIDLWALRVGLPNKAEVLASDYGAGPAPLGPDSQVLIEPSFATPGTPDQRLLTSPEASAKLAAFLQKNWIPGGFLFLRLNPSSGTDFGGRPDGGTSDQGYDFGSADHRDQAQLPALQFFP
jgi:hypothetical protein